MSNRCAPALVDANRFRPVMTEIVWIASYPRSGNTWLRFLLANLLLPKVERSTQVATTLPDIHRFVTGRHLLGPDRSFIKTHWAWHPSLPLRENTAAVVYLVRHPIDVVQSALNYGALMSGDALRNATPAHIDRFSRDFVGDFVKYGGDAGWYRQGFGTWTENVAGWTEAALPFRRHVVTYEALRTDPQTELATIARFLDLPASAEKVSSAVANCTMERLAALEEEELRMQAPGIFPDRLSTKSTAQGFRFIGGGSGRRLELTAQERSALRERFAPTMAKHGYD